MLKTIKIISTIVIIIALGIVITNFLPIFPEVTNSSFFKIITWLASFSLISHFIEAVIIYLYTYKKAANPMKLAVYTFFTGTMGLTEIWKNIVKNDDYIEI
jgi:hypothetical protein